MLSGPLRRPPRWMRRAGFEWLFRLLQEPSRFRRMTGLPAFAWKIFFPGESVLEKNARCDKLDGTTHDPQ
jgi:N-acetylglucosaminyldiphosphoundecaprenol N-acetyl-beta-D-mannosaminyltransferase